jgi:zinc protease
MRLFRPLAFILTAVIATSGNAQTPEKPAATPPKPKPAAKTATPGADILPFQATEKTLPNGLKVIVVPTGFPNIV